MTPLIRIKSSYDKTTQTAKALFDVYDTDAGPGLTVAKGGIETPADSAEHGELGAIDSALGAIAGVGFSGIEIQSDSENIRKFLEGTNNPTSHTDLRRSIKGRLVGKTIVTNPLPLGYSATYTKVTSAD